MALLKQVEIKNSGAEVEYWKVSQLNINWHKKQSHCVLEGFLSKEARDDGKLPLDSRSWSWSGDEFPFSDEGSNVGEAYDTITNETSTDEEGNVTDGEFKGTELI